jgi:hypothetical protein
VAAREAVVTAPKGLRWERSYYGHGDERWTLAAPGPMLRRWGGGIQRKGWTDYVDADGHAKRRRKRWLAYVILPSGKEPLVGWYDKRGAAKHHVEAVVRAVLGRKARRRA